MAIVPLRVRGVPILLFFSGACALVYQVAWFRELRLIFGASTASSAAVLAIFMGGLGLGGAKLGKRADASKNPIAMYAGLEIAVSIMAGLTPALVWLANALYLAAGGATTLGSIGASALRVALSVVVLGPATFLMGGTLPAAARAVERDDDSARRSVATLYGVNTFGAVVGALGANFLLLEVLGTQMTLWAAALVNVLVGVVARAISRLHTPGHVPTPIASTPARTTAAGSLENADTELSLPAEATLLAQAHATESAAAREPRERTDDGAIGRPAAAPWFPPAASALVGASFMLMELTWYRMLAPLLGGSSYTFGLILAVALAGIALGGAAYARTKVPATLRAFAITCSLEALFIAIPYATGDGLALTTALVRPLCRVGFGSSTAVWTAIAAFVVFPAAVVSGIQFPLVIGLYGRGAQRVGRDVGDAYLANTIGSIVGSLAGGFGLIPLLGAIGSWKLVVVSLSIGATTAVVLDARIRSRPALRTVASALAVWLPALLLLFRGPTVVWRHSGIGAGRADPKLEGANAETVKSFVQKETRNIRWQEDGLESSVALGQGSGFTFIVNGKSDGHATVDAPTQVMSGLLAGLLHGNPKSALIVGLGTGSSAGWLGAVPSVERVDVIELEPAILRVARDCAPINEEILDNPKVKIHLADAREHLRTTRDRYDVIFSEPSNPYRAGISSLYTVEYYRAAAERVAKGGLFVQWVQAYEIDGWALATAIVTLRQAFGDVQVWQTMPGDLLLVARAEPTPIDIAQLRRSLGIDVYARAVRNVWRTDSAEGVLSHFIATGGLAQTLIERELGAVNTDDQNFLEFAFARSVGRLRSVDIDLAALSRRLGFDVPPTTEHVDRVLVDEERALYRESEGVVPPTGPRESLFPTLGAFSSGRHAAALESWRAMNRKAPRSLGERALLAECVARAGSDADVAVIDLAPLPERDVLKALWAARHDDRKGAVEALIRALSALRVAPWGRRSLVTNALTLSAELGVDPRFAGPLYEALKHPFAVEEVREHRLQVAAQIASVIADPSACREAFHALEPPALDRKMLELRARCYRRANDPRTESAEKDLLEAMEFDTPLGASIPTPPGVASRNADAGSEVSHMGPDASSAASELAADAGSDGAADADAR